MNDFNVMIHIMKAISKNVKESVIFIYGTFCIMSNLSFRYDDIDLP